MGLLARNRESIKAAAGALGFDCRVEPVKLKRGKRAWRALTAGLLVTRDVYGEQTKRFYCRGLPAAERERWSVNKHVGERGYSRTGSPRAWSGDRVVLVPPELWRLQRADRRDLRRKLAAASSPESVRAIMALATQLASARSSLSSLHSPAVGRLDALPMRKRGIPAAMKGAQSSTIDSGSGSLPPFFEKGGYSSSVHSGDPPGGRDGPTDADLQLGFGGLTRRERVAQLQSRPWDELTVDERKEVWEWVADNERHRPIAERERTDRAKRALLDQLESLRKKISGSKGDG
jgi:hypothetical protein